ncbi:MAG: hypothetical protein LBS19_02780 [Clostridiales bacterium]|jgi:hypothetical protein|nr:hypothetical protein [Clostridiales bacterium]
MVYYVVVKRAALQSGERTFSKDNIITAYDVGHENIERYLKKGYIKPLKEKSSDDEAKDYDTLTDDGTEAEDGAATDADTSQDKREELPFYMTPAQGEYLAPNQLDRLSKTQLVEYAGRIGCAGFKQNISVKELRDILKDFINEILEDAEMEDEGEDDGMETDTEQ